VFITERLHAQSLDIIVQKLLTTQAKAQAQAQLVQHRVTVPDLGVLVMRRADMESKNIPQPQRSGPGKIVSMKVVDYGSTVTYDHAVQLAIVQIVQVTGVHVRRRAVVPEFRLIS